MKAATIMATMLGATAATAEPTRLGCEWLPPDAPGYRVDFMIDQDAQRATRSDGPSTYRLLLASERAFWLQLDRPGTDAMVLQIIERSSSGGAWTDMWVYANGTVASAAYGQCLEAP